MITRKELEEKVNHLKELTGISSLYLEYSKYPTGYRLCSITKNGGYAGVFGRSTLDKSLSSKEMDSFLDGLIAGLKYQVNQEKK